MGKLIICTSSEENIGVTSYSLLFAKDLAEKSHKKVVLVDMNLIQPDIYKIMSSEELQNKNLDIIMSYALAEKDLKTVIDGNIDRLNNSDLHIIMGPTTNTSYSPTQYENFINEIKNMYDIVVFDTTIKQIPKIILDKTDYIMLLVNQNFKMLSNFKKSYGNIIDDGRTKIIVNKYENNILSINKIGQLLNTRIIYTLPYDKTLIKKLNEGNLNISDSIYEEKLSIITNELLSELGIVKKKKFDFSTLLKRKNRKEVDKDVTIAQ